MTTPPFPQAPIRHRINNSLAQLEAAKASMGMTLLPCFLGDRESDLRRVTQSSVDGRDIWILTHEDLRRAARVQVFTQFIAAALLKNRALIEGKCAFELSDDDTSSLQT
ncbi:MAG: hypothetical protein GY822_16980 [Deltaproteobacteria bacterium]|nr:hypothetical protein [Deltaproteobacteria bacterium]